MGLVDRPAHDDPMIRSTRPLPHRLLGVTTLAAATLVAATACTPRFGGLEGSGTPETTAYAFDDFDEIAIRSAFRAEITLAPGAPTVEITVDDNFTEHLEVELDGDRLEVGFEHGNYDPDVTPTAIITVPDLTYLDGSGASEVSVASPIDADRLAIHASGASEVTMAAIEADGLTVDASGASSVSAADTTVGELVVDASGASEITIGGEADLVDLDAHGASAVDLTTLDAQDGTVDLSGASEAELGPIDRIEGSLSGASELVASDRTNLAVTTSGASELTIR